jgi:hypothetical protein
MGVQSFRISKVSKKKEMVVDKDGEWVRRSDYERLLWEYNSCKEEWSLDNAMLNLVRIIENMKLNPNITLSLQILSSSMMVCMKSMVEKGIKDKQNSEEQSTNN